MTTNQRISRRQSICNPSSISEGPLVTTFIMVGCLLMVMSFVRQRLFVSLYFAVLSK
jgi:hypothetical protein